MIQLFVYFLVLTSILLLPDGIWDKLWAIGERTFAYLKKLEEHYAFLPEFSYGEKLLGIMPNIEAKMSMGLKTITFELPQYKFYTGLLFNLLEIHRRLGVSLKSILPELRGNLIKDVQFEKKLRENIFGGNIQFLVITITTWCFIFLSSKLAELPLKTSNLVLILFMQLSGVFVFNSALKQLKSRTFAKFNQAIERLYLFTSLAEVGLPVSQTLLESKVLEGHLVEHKLFSPCASRLTTLVNRWKENGISPKIEASEVTLELWHLKEMGFGRFLKHLELLKFTILAFFFLPAYFLYLYSIFQFFMEQ